MVCTDVETDPVGNEKRTVFSGLYWDGLRFPAGEGTEDQSPREISLSEDHDVEFLMGVDHLFWLSRVLIERDRRSRNSVSRQIFFEVVIRFGKSHIFTETRTSDTEGSEVRS